MRRLPPSTCPPTPSARLAGRALTAVLLAATVLVGLLVVPTVGLARVAATPGPYVMPDEAATPLATVITDSDGRPIARLFEQNRRRTEPAEIADTMKAAIVAIEDRRFFDHDGVDVIGTGRALVENLFTSGNPLDGQGASTITMQYASNQRLYTADGPRERAAAVADTVARKVGDIAVAVALESRLDKQDILTRYLDTVYFGHGAYGIAAAARTFFDTIPAELTLPQAALLAGMVKAPTTFDPVQEPAAATARRDLVLTAMAEVGSITPDQAAIARSAGLGLAQPLVETQEGCVGADPGTGFFCRYVVDHLAARGLELGELRTGGYTVRTTMDREAAEAAARAAARQAPVTRTNGIANAVAVVQPGRDSRRVLALAANRELGPDAEAGQSAYPLPTSAVPYGAGSVYKIFTAAAALEAGIGLDSRWPAPERYVSRQFTNGSRPYTVSGASGAEADVTLGRALALSPNTTFIALLDQLGSVDPVVDMARRLGLRQGLALPSNHPGLSVGDAVRAEQRASFSLGPVPTIPLELANVAATVVSGGTWCPPNPIEGVTDRRGAPVPVATQPCEQAVPEDLANAVAAGLSNDHTVGTAADAAAAAGWDRPMIGKTGTTQEHLSAAFLGATPRYAGAVMTWSDASPPRPVCAGSPPRQCADGTLFGGDTPARTWFAAMQPLHQGLPVAGLPGFDAGPRAAPENGPDIDDEEQDENEDEEDDE
ncbi:MAG: transglycosylase domain-containing protein [Pseudonocardia sp.]